MAPNLEKICYYLAQLNFKYQIKPQEECIYLGFKGDNVDNLIIIIELEEQRYLKLSALNLIPELKKHRYQELIYRTLLSLSSSSIVKYQYDIIDGEVRAVVALPLVDSNLTFEQFNHCLFGLIYHLDTECFPRIEEVMETGKDPQEAQLGEQILLILEEIAPKGFLDLLDSALKVRLSRGNTASIAIPEEL